ncbi:MAG: FtsW/RodA/SpoVE family cell cycle protein [Candidatus Xenobiia bacterium LiM19]
MKIKIHYRKAEFWLLLLLSLIYCSGIALIRLAQHEDSGISVIMTAVPLLLAIWTTHGVLTLTKSQTDQMLMPLMAFLSITGHLEIYRLEPALAFKQVLFILAGFTLFNIWYLWGFDYRLWEDYKYLVLFSGIAIQIAVMILGTEINGAKLWFRIGSINFQPVEIVKILIVVFLASYLKQKKEFITSHPRQWLDSLSFKYLIPLIIMLGCCELILVVQKDMGMALLLFGTFICLFYIATERTGMILCAFVLFIISSWVLMERFPHVHVRFAVWLDPWRDPGGSGYQILQSLFSLSAGGFWGTGLGMGSPGLIPAVHTDFVFASIGEEMGFLGAMAVILAYLFVVHRVFRVSLQCHDEFGILFAAGLGALLACQVFIIIGGTIKFIPMTGITLPFISYGGSSVISNFFLMALVFQIAEQAAKKGHLQQIRKR